MAFSSVYTGSAAGMRDLLGVSFEDQEFAVVVDLNVKPTDDFGNSLSTDVNVLADLVNSSNPKITSDSNPDSDQQFFIAYKNISGIETAYLAMQHMAGDLVIDGGSLYGTHSFGSFNASAPFQTLLQHYKSNGSHVFAANTFRGFVAYTATEDDPQIDTSDQSYIGYPIVEQRLIQKINEQLTSRGLSTLAPFDTKPIWGNNEFGMTYKNMFVVFQDTASDSAKSLFPSFLQQFVRGLDLVALGGDIKAAALFDYVNFTYKLQTSVNNDTHTIVDTVVDYDLGPVSLLITRDDDTTFTNLVNNVPGIDNTNSFRTPSFDIVLELGVQNLQVVITIPSLSIYTGTAARTRINSAALNNQAEGFGISVVTSTNVWTQDKDPDLASSQEGTITDAKDLVIDLDAFKTSFQGKSVYDITYDNGTTKQEDIIVSLFSLNQLSSLLNTANVFGPYFRAQSKLTNGFITLAAKERFSSAILSPQSIGMDVDKIDYATFIQMPKWSGNKITQDPTYSAVSVVSASEQPASSSAGGAPQTDTRPTSLVPGFEFVSILLAIPMAIWIRKKRN